MVEPHIRILDFVVYYLLVAIFAKIFHVSLHGAKYQTKQQKGLLAEFFFTISIRNTSKTSIFTIQYEK